MTKYTYRLLINRRAILGGRQIESFHPSDDECLDYIFRTWGRDFPGKTITIFFDKEGTIFFDKKGEE